MTRTRGSSLTSLLSRAMGRALGLSSGSHDKLEHLEPRQLLEGSFLNPLPLPNPDADGRVVVAGNINPALVNTNNDTYRFVAPAAGFVTVLGDTSNETAISNLDTAVEVWNAAGTTLIASGTNNGTLTSGFQRDGWAGFVATAGTEYRIVVKSDAGSPQGTYTLRLRATNATFDIGGDQPTVTGIARAPGSPVPDAGAQPPVGPQAIVGQLGGLGPVNNRLRQDEIVYTFTVPAGNEWNSLVTVNAQGAESQLINRLDTHIDVYNASGTLVTSDEQTGRFNDAFVTFRARPNEQFFIRVRSDEVRTNNIRLATGAFYLVLDAIATPVQLDPLTRRSPAINDAFDGFDPANPAPDPVPAPNTNPPTFQSESFSFVAQGSGRAIITATPTGLSPVTDPALRLYNAAGQQIAFNNNFSGLVPQLEVELVGNERYFVIVDGFAANNGVQFQLFIEANHTFSTAANQQNDDHLDSPFGTGQNTNRDLEDATPLPFGTPTLTFDVFGNPVRDRNWVTTATGEGRIYQAGDTDLFQFTAPYDMLDSYDGNDDNAGTALYIGGDFGRAEPGSAFPVDSRNLTIWDAADYWFTGNQNVVQGPNGPVQLGFVNNEDTAATDRAEVRALFNWTPGPGQRPILVVGGDFTLNFLADPTDPTSLATVNNLAIWAFNAQLGTYVWSDALGGASGPVNVIETYDPEPFDPDGTGDGPPLTQAEIPFGESLFIGGLFDDIGGTAAANVAFFDPQFGAWFGTNAGLETDGEVFAFAVYDAEDAGDERDFQAGPPVLGAVPDPVDPPESLYIGGAMTGGIVRYNGFSTDSINTGTPTPTDTINGTVFSLKVFDVDVTGTDLDLGEGGVFSVLVIGGDFVADYVYSVPVPNPPPGAPAFANEPRRSSNLVFWGFVDTLQDAQIQQYTPRLMFGNPFSNELQSGQPDLDGAVRALEIFDPADINNGTVDPVLMIGGDFVFGGDPTVANLITYSTDQQPGTIGTPDGPVFSLRAVDDVQEPGIEDALDSGNQQQVLYLGGQFTEIQPPNPLQPPIPANNIAQFAAETGPNAPDDFFTFRPVGNVGAGGVSNLGNPAPDAAVFALSDFDDGILGQWDRHDRPATRLAITLNPVFGGGSTGNFFIRLLDSQGRVFYQSDTIDPTADIPGAVDPSLAASLPQLPQDIVLPDEAASRIWGGETYYLEVSAGGTGRYQFSITADAGGQDVNDDGVRDNMGRARGSFRETANEGQFNLATQARTGGTLATGDTDIVVNPNQASQNVTGHDISGTFIRPSLDGGATFAGGLGLIQDINDTDLYFFRAEFTGAAEIRLGTSQLQDVYGQQTAGGARLRPNAGGGATSPWNPTDESLTKTYDSRFDGAIRVFANDFTQIGYNDDNFAHRNDGRLLPGGVPVGEFDDFVGVGTFDAQFRREDPRVVIPVVAGQIYFIQVESGQKWSNGRVAPPAPGQPDLRVANTNDTIDWSRAFGSYQLLINGMGDQITDFESGNVVVDDHDNSGTIAAATPIPIGDEIGTVGNGRGVITGVINNTPTNNPQDFDTFTFTAPGTGTASVRLTRINGSTLNASFEVFRENGANVGAGIQQGGGTLLLTFPVNAGEVYSIDVNGQGVSEGAYQLEVFGMPAADDHADANKFWNATEVSLSDFTGSTPVPGRINQPGDTDVFKFEFPEYQRLQFRVDATTATLTPRIQVYEITENPSGQEGVIRMRVGVGEGFTPPNSPNASATTLASVTPARTRGNVDDGDFREYRYYYVVVEGTNNISDFGDYNLIITSDPTDDHPDADTNGDGNFDNGQASQATPIVLDSLSGTGIAPGNIELNGDTDLLRFTLPAEGNVSVTLTRVTDSFLRARLSLLKLNNDGSFTVLAQSTMPDSLASVSIVSAFDSSTLANVSRGDDIYIAVDAVGAGTNTQLGTTGAYSLAISAPPLDDHANRTEWELATIIPIDGTTGRGQIGSDIPDNITNPRINPNNDDDLFTFTVLNAGVHNITLTPFISTLGTLATRIRVYRDDGSSNFTLVGTATSSAAGQAAAFTVNNATAGQRYFVLVDALGLAGASPVGEYRVTVQGPAGGGGGGGGTDPSFIDFNNPTTVVLNTRTGDGSSLGSTTNPQASIIQPAGDRDLYAFTTAAAGRVFLRLSTPAGSTLDAQIQVLRDNGDGTRTVIATDADGLPGSTAQLSFGSPANVRYFVIVDGLGESVGGYQLDIQTEAAVKRLVYPEGFSSDTVSEFVPIVNPNVFPVDFRLTLYYDDGTAPTQLPGGTMLPNSRDGYTITAVINGQIVRAPGVIPNKPYSVVLEWTVPSQYVNSQGQIVPVDPATIQPLGATLSHYDFGSSTGDAFTETVATTWNFPRVERNPGAALNFILFWNPHNYEVDVTLTGYLADGSRVTLPEVRRVRPLGREGFSINDFAQLGTGIFGAQINATPVASDAQLAVQPFEGVVASITAYRFGGGNESAFGALGDAQGGTTKGAVTNITNGNGVSSEITFFNPSTSPATVNLSATYIRNNITASQRTIQVPAGRSVTVTGASLGLVAGDAAGIRYTSDLPVSVLSYQSQRGDADASTTQYQAGTRFFFGDAFINGATAGRLYFETLYFYNPTSVANNATVNILFYNEPGTTNPRANTSVNISIPANGFQQLRLHELQAIVGGGLPSFFAIDITGALPFQVTMEHYDLFLGGGWSAAPVPFGIKTPVASI
ncbi:MAG TPA: hypothetical protein VK157_15055 [Phycisphaerales bacterium]|nr:hypothetical protein [Phycisphaerales bacterium]